MLYLTHVQTTIYILFKMSSAYKSLKSVFIILNLLSLLRYISTYRYTYRESVVLLTNAHSGKKYLIKENILS